MVHCSSIDSITFCISGFRNLGESRSLSIFSHPRLLKCCQAQISPKFVKLEMRKHWQGSKFTKIPKILASMGSAGAIVAQTLGIFGKFDPCQCSGISSYLIPVDVFASDVAKMLPGSNFPKVSEARHAKTLAGIKFPQNS